MPEPECGSSRVNSEIAYRFPASFVQIPGRCRSGGENNSPPEVTSRAGLWVKSTGVVKRGIHCIMTNKISAVVSVLMGGQPKGLQCNLQFKICKLCDTRTADSPQHILLECDALKATRDPKMEDILICLPRGMQNSIDAMDIREKFVFLASGLKCDSFIEEWSYILIKVCNFVYDIYVIRKSQYDMLETMNI